MWFMTALSSCRPICTYWFFMTVVMTWLAAATENIAASVGDDVTVSTGPLSTPAVSAMVDNPWVLQPRLTAVSSTTGFLQESVDGTGHHPRIEVRGTAEPEEEMLQSRAQKTGASPGTATWSNLLRPAQQNTPATVNRVGSTSATVNRADSTPGTVNIVDNDSSAGPLYGIHPATRQDNGFPFSPIEAGNLGLEGFPVSLGHPNNYLVPIHDEATPPPKPTYSGLGEDLRLHHSLLFGGSFNGQTSQQLASFGNQIPGYVFPDASYDSLGPPDAGSLGEPTQESPSRLTTTKPRSSSTPTPSVLGTLLPHVSKGVTSFFYSTRSPLQTQNNQLQLLEEYYANYEAGNPGSSHQQNEPTSPDRLDLQSNPESIFLPAETPFTPAFNNMQASLDSDLETDMDDGFLTPVAATLSSSTSQNCFSNTLCILSLAAVLALGLTTAFVSPFFSSAFIGRRKRSIDYIVLPEESVTTLVNYHGSHLESEPLSAPAMEGLIFKNPRDLADTYTTQLLTRLEHFLMNKGDKFFNITRQEAQSKVHRPLPGDVFEKPNKGGSFHTTPESLESEAGGTPVYKQENKSSRTSQVEGQSSPRHPDDTRGRRPSLSNGHSRGVVHPGGFAAVSHLPLPYHMTHSNPLHHGPSYPGWTVSNPSSAWPRLPHTSNHPPPYYGAASLTHHSPAHDTQLWLLPQVEGRWPPGYRRAASFYRTVCSALSHPHTPHTDVTKFIADKCIILQLAGVI